MRGDGPISYISASGCVGEAHAAGVAGGCARVICPRRWLAEPLRRAGCSSQLDQHNQQHDQNGVCPDDWHDIAGISPELAYTVLERAPLASVIRMRSSEEIPAVVRFARAASTFAGARSLLGGRQERLVLRQRSLLRRTQQRFAPRHRGDRRKRNLVEVLAALSSPSCCEPRREAASQQLQRRPHAPLKPARVPSYRDVAARCGFRACRTHRSTLCQRRDDVQRVALSVGERDPHPNSEECRERSHDVLAEAPRFLSSHHL